MKGILPIASVLIPFLIAGGCRMNRPASEPSIRLEDYLWKNRLLFIFAPSPENENLRRTRQDLDRRAQGVLDRDLIVFQLLANGRSRIDGRILSAADASALRDRFGIPPDRFALILVGKDGGEKLRSDAHIPLDEIFGVIDAMPMRRREMQEKQGNARQDPS